METFTAEVLEHLQHLCAQGGAHSVLPHTLQLPGLRFTVGLCVSHAGVCVCTQASVYAYKSGKRIEDPFTPDTRISKLSSGCHIIVRSCLSPKVPTWYCPEQGPTAAVTSQYRPLPAWQPVIVACGQDSLG